MSQLFFYTTVTVILLTFSPLEIGCAGNLMGKIVYALNAGGPAVRDSYGIEYAADRLPVGIASDYGSRFWSFDRVPNHEDSVLYQTERWASQDFVYDVTVKEDGNYVLVLKFSEVYFNRPGKKVFNVELNGLVIVENLDIYQRVGSGVAHDEIIPFKIFDKGQKLIVEGQTAKIVGSKLKIKFVKGNLDNPKVNAFYILKGTVSDVPTLLPLERDYNVEDAVDDWNDEDDSEDLIVDHHDQENVVQPKSKSRNPTPHRYYPEDEPDWWTSALQIGGAIMVCVVVFYFVKKVVM